MPIITKITCILHLLHSVIIFELENNHRWLVFFCWMRLTVWSLVCNCVFTLVMSYGSAGFVVPQLITVGLEVCTSSWLFHPSEISASIWCVHEKNSTSNLAQNKCSQICEACWFSQSQVMHIMSYFHKRNKVCFTHRTNTCAFLHWFRKIMLKSCLPVLGLLYCYVV